MSTAQKLATKLMKHYGLVFRVTKQEGYYDLLMPYLLMDASYHFVKKVGEYRQKGLIRHKAAMYFNRWKSAYKDFFDTIFAVFPSGSEESDAVIDLMDRMEDYIAHDIEIAKFCGSACFIEYDDSREDILTATLMANIFSMEAYKIMGLFLREANLSRTSKARLHTIVHSAGAVLQNSKNFGAEIMGSDAESEISGRRLENLANSEKTILNRIKLWVKEEIKNESK